MLDSWQLQTSDDTLLKSPRLKKRGGGARRARGNRRAGQCRSHAATHTRPRRCAVGCQTITRRLGRGSARLSECCHRPLTGPPPRPPLVSWQASARPMRCRLPGARTVIHHRKGSVVVWRRRARGRSLGLERQRPTRRSAVHTRKEAGREVRTGRSATPAGATRKGLESSSRVEPGDETCAPGARPRYDKLS
jgi:hypothetical protein